MSSKIEVRGALLFTSHFCQSKACRPTTPPLKFWLQCADPVSPLARVKIPLS